MRLYLIHCGFYDEEISNGIYEFHINIPVTANDLEEAKRKVRMDATFQKKKMHIDGIQEIKAVDGFLIEFKPCANSETDMTCHQYRDL
jgi:hypothetical protein